MKNILGQSNIDGNVVTYVEEILSDGSKVYNVEITCSHYRDKGQDTIIFSPSTRLDAHNLYEAIIKYGD